MLVCDSFQWCWLPFFLIYYFTVCAESVQRFIHTSVSFFLNFFFFFYFANIFRFLIEQISGVITVLGKVRISRKYVLSFGTFNAFKFPFLLEYFSGVLIKKICLYSVSTEYTEEWNLTKSNQLTNNRSLHVYFLVY